MLINHRFCHPLKITLVALATFSTTVFADITGKPTEQEMIEHFSRINDKGVNTAGILTWEFRFCSSTMSSQEQFATEAFKSGATPVGIVNGPVGCPYLLHLETTKALTLNSLTALLNELFEKADGSGIKHFHGFSVREAAR